MISVVDVLDHIAQELYGYSGGDPQAAIEEVLRACTLQFRMAVTDDVEEAEADFLDRIGRGHTFYFRLADYEHGRQLAEQMFWIFEGSRPGMDGYTGEMFAPDAQLYLFVHVQAVIPAIPGAAIGNSGGS
jgi:hypothetical protein